MIDSASLTIARIHALWNAARPSWARERSCSMSSRKPAESAIRIARPTGRRRPPALYGALLEYRGDHKGHRESQDRRQRIARQQTKRGKAPLTFEQLCGWETENKVDQRNDDEQRGTT